MNVKHVAPVMIRFKLKPRPDHPNENKSALVNAAHICLVQMETSTYKPEANAPVAIHPSAKMLTNIELVIVYLVTGTVLAVEGTFDEVVKAIETACQLVVSPT